MSKKNIIGIVIVIILAVIVGFSLINKKEAVNQGQAVEITIEVPEGIEQGKKQGLNWIRLDQLDTYSSFRKNFDDALKITKYGVDSKNGIMYADLEGNQEGNNTLFNGFANKKFRENYWENDAVQLQTQQYASEQYADVAVQTTDAKMAALNGYYNIFSDADPNFFNGGSLISRGEFMTAIYKAETPVGSITSDASFTAMVGQNEYTDYAKELAGDSYLRTGSKSLNEKTFGGTITRGEAIYMLVSHYYGDDLAEASGKSDKVDVKNAGDIAGKQKYDGDYADSYELVYSIQNSEKGAPDRIYKALQVAYDKGILTAGEESRWEEGLTKTEALDLLTKTYSSMPSVHGVEKGKGNGTALPDESPEDKASNLDEMTAVTSEVFTEAEEEIVKAEVEEGLLEVPEEVSITALDEYRYTTTDVALREKASVGSEKLDTVATSTKVHAIGITEDGQWVKVDGINGQEGFISAAYLQSTAPTTQQKQEAQEQKDKQAELEKQGEANTQQIQQQNQDKSLSEIQSDIMDILGAPNGDSLNNLPTSEYQGNQGTGLLHAE